MSEETIKRHASVDTNMRGPCRARLKLARLWSISGRPYDGRYFLVACGVEEFYQAMSHAIFMHELRHFHIETAIARDLHDLAFTPPLNGLQSLGGLSTAERGFSNLVQLGTVIDRLVQMIAESYQKKPFKRYCVLHVSDRQQADFFAEKLSQMIQLKPLFIDCVSSVIGVHAGKGAVAIAFDSGD